MARGSFQAAALLLAAGSGERLGSSRPKAFIDLAGRPLLAWSCAALTAAQSVGRLVIACPDGLEQEARDIAAEYLGEVELTVITGGSTRSRSVAAALDQVRECEIVVVHDAARPFVTADLVETAIARLVELNCDGVVVAEQVGDTVKLADQEMRVLETLDRSKLWAVQTPQVFWNKALRSALEQASEQQLDTATDDASLLEKAGCDLRLLEYSSALNFKITTARDLELARALIEQKGAQAVAD